VTRKLTATTGVLLALVFAGCGKDDSSNTTAQSAATATTPAATTPAATTTSGAKASKKKQASGSKTTTGSTGKTSKSSGSKSSGSTTTTTKKAATPKKKTTAKKPVGVTPGSGAGADPSSGTGSGPAEERLAVVSVLRRYYKAFLDKDGNTACSLLTSDGQDIMVKDGGAKSCADSVVRLIKQAGSGNLTLLETTRDGLHVNDITITGNNATAQIGKTSRLRLVQVSGHWLVRSPNVVNAGG
jgi:transglutaminase/protease-like cytokinesis protein 3